MADAGQGGPGPDGWPRGSDGWNTPPTAPLPLPPPPPTYPPPGYPPPGYPVAYQPVPAVPVYYQAVVPVVMEAPKSKVTAALLAFFLGTLGIHNFYLGRTALGVTQLLLATIGGVLTCGLATLGVAAWAFVEFIVILCGGINDRYGRPLV